MHTAGSALGEFVANLASSHQHLLRIDSPASSDVSDSVSDTSSVRDAHEVNPLDNEEIQGISCQISKLKNSLLYLNPQASVPESDLRAIGAKFNDDLTIQYCDSSSLPPNYVEYYSQSIRSSSFPDREASYLPFGSILTLAEPRQPTVPSNLWPIASTTPPIRLNAGTSLPPPNSETQVQLEPSASFVQAVSATARKRTVKNLHNPLFVLDPDRFGSCASRCWGCFTRTQSFMRAIFKQIRTHAAFLKISKTDIDSAEAACGAVTPVLGKLRKIWECLFTHIKPIPLIYPIVGRDHIHRTGRRRTSGTRLPVTSQAGIAPAAVAIQQPTRQSSTPPSTVSQNSSQLPQSSGVVTPELRQIPSLPGLAPVDTQSGSYDARFKAQGIQIEFIVQHLRRLHSHSHDDRLNENRLLRIEVLKNAINSIRSFCALAAYIIFSEPATGRTVANIDDFSDWSMPRATRLDARDMNENAQDIFIDVVKMNLDSLHAQTSYAVSGSQCVWRTSVLDITIQRVSHLLDEATRSMNPVAKQMVVDYSHQPNSSLPARRVASTASDISQLPSEISSSTNVASPQSMSTDFTSIDNNEQLTSAIPKSPSYGHNSQQQHLRQT